MPSAALLRSAATILSEAASEGRLIPLVGMSASMAAPLGLPGWPRLVERMAWHTRAFQPSRASLMLDELSRGELLRAASFYPEGDRVPRAERRRLFEKLLAVPPDRVPECIATLGGLPWRHIVTTSFDDCLRRSVARSHGVAGVDEVRSPRFEPLLASWSERRSIVYLHGHASDHDSLLYTRRGYESARANAGYREVLRRLFLENTVLAFGFSFADPSFQELLEFVDQELNGNTDRRHIAILSEDAPVSEELLSRANFLTLRYTPSGDEHDEGLRTLLRVTDGLGAGRPRAPTTPSPRRERELRELCPSYLSLLEASGGSAAGFEMACATLVAGALTRAPAGATLEETAQDVARSLHAPLATIEPVVRIGMCHLDADERLASEGGRLTLTARIATEDPYARLRSLVRAVEVRAQLHDAGFRSTGGVRRAIAYIVGSSMIVQGSTAARAFREEDPTDGYELEPMLSEAAGRIEGLAPPARALLARASAEVLRAPDSAASRSIFELANAAYVLESLLLCPAPSSSPAAPSRVYLDAEVVLRALSPAHPRHRQFKAILQWLRREGTPIYVLYPFVEEIVHHVDRVGALIRESGITSTTELYGYVASIPEPERSPVLLLYLGEIARRGWEDFGQLASRMGLRDAAGVARLVGELGVRVERRGAVPEASAAEHDELWEHLRSWRGRDHSRPRRRLSRAEAAQIVWSASLRESGVRSSCLSIDAELRQALKVWGDPRYAGLVATPPEWAHRLAAIHRRGEDCAGFAEMMWSAPCRTAAEAAP